MFLNDLSILGKFHSSEINFLLLQVNKQKLRLMIFYQWKTDNSFLRQQKDMTKKFDKFTFVATDAANIMQVHSFLQIF